MRRETPDRACAGRSGREDRVPLADDELACELVTAERWDDLAQLFESSAGTSRGVTPSTCWCMVWRDTQPVKRTTPAIRRARLRTIVDAGTPVGVIGYLEGRAVAWCSVAPRASYARTDAFGFAGGRYEAGTDVWTIVCFYALPELRGRQASARLVEAACAYAAQAGADVVEAFPVAAGENSNFSYMGSARTFLRAGFEDAGASRKPHRLMRRRLLT